NRADLISIISDVRRPSPERSRALKAAPSRRPRRPPVRGLRSAAQPVPTTLSLPGTAGGKTMTKTVDTHASGLPADTVPAATPRKGMTASGLPQAQGLYDPKNEHDACGVGFIAHMKGVKSHQIVKDGLFI